MTSARLFCNKKLTSPSLKTAAKPSQSPLDSKISPDFLKLFNCVGNIMDLNPRPGMLSDCTTEFSDYVRPGLERGRTRS